MHQDDGAYIYVTAPRGLKASSCSKKGALSREARRHAAACSSGTSKQRQWKYFRKYLKRKQAEEVLSKVLVRAFFSTRATNEVVRPPPARVCKRAPSTPFQTGPRRSARLLQLIRDGEVRLQQKINLLFGQQVRRAVNTGSNSRCCAQNLATQQHKT